MAPSLEYRKGEKVNSNITGFGSKALANVNTTSALHNIGLGFQSGNNISSGQRNIAIGDNSAKGITVGNSSISIGYNAMYSCSNGISNAVAIGYKALNNGVANGTIAIGESSLRACTDAAGCVAIGRQSLRNVTVNPYNTAIGL